MEPKRVENSKRRREVDKDGIIGYTMRTSRIPFLEGVSDSIKSTFKFGPRRSVRE
jgi:hypothetical protein